jgi:hypothetical protein
MVNRDTDRYDLKIRVGRKTAVIDTTCSHRFWGVTRDTWVAQLIRGSVGRVGDNDRGPSAAAGRWLASTAPEAGSYRPRLSASGERTTSGRAEGDDGTRHPI